MDTPEPVRILLADDMPEFFVPFLQQLEQHSHIVTVRRDLEDAWRLIEARGRFDLVVIDMAFDCAVQTADLLRHQTILDSHLRGRGYGGLGSTGQLLGLQLWRGRRQRPTAYCYLSAHPDIWIENVPAGDPEFSGVSALEEGVVIDKTQLWPGNVVERLQQARAVWAVKGWL